MALGDGYGLTERIGYRYGSRKKKVVVPSVILSLGSTRRVTASKNEVTQKRRDSEVYSTTYILQDINFRRYLYTPFLMVSVFALYKHFRRKLFKGLLYKGFCRKIYILMGVPSLPYIYSGVEGTIGT